jgi:hypothetical protein
MKFRTAVRVALESRLNTWAKAKPIPVAFANIKFTPPSTAYLATYFLPADTFNVAICYGSEVGSGVFQVSINVPINTGVALAESLAQEIDTLFPAGLELATADGTIRITTPVSTSEFFIGSSHATLAVSITYSTL